MTDATRDAAVLTFVADRLVNVYGESENVDFVLALRRMAATPAKAIEAEEPQTWAERNGWAPGSYPDEWDRWPARPANETTGEPPTFKNTGRLNRHDLGCRCWPHVSEQDALDAVAATGLAEYRDGLTRTAPSTPAGDGLREAREKLSRVLYEQMAGYATTRAAGAEHNAEVHAALMDQFDRYMEAALASQPRNEDGLDVERDSSGRPLRLWWCPAWGTLNAVRYHGNAGPDDPNCGVVSYYRAAQSGEAAGEGEGRG